MSTVLAPSPEPPPVNDGGQRLSTAVNGGEPPPDPRSTVVNRQSMVGQRWPRGSHVVPRGNTWHHVATDVAVEVAVDCGGGGVKDGIDCGMTVDYIGEDSLITETGTVRSMGVFLLGTS
ncbi:hypothetical protein Tco_1061157 [Tanacetum coccineum]